MKVNLLATSSTSALFEIDNEEIVHTNTPYTILLNSEVYETNQTSNVFSLYHLTPNTSYELGLLNEKTQEMMSFKFVTDEESICLNVKRFNAKGDGITDDTLAIQTAIMACPMNGRVFIPKGIYLVKTIFLKSDLTLEFEKGDRKSVV